MRLFSAGPSQDGRIVYPGKANLLHTDNIEVRLAQQQSPHDVAVEVLIGQQPQHASSSHLPAGEQASTDVAQIALLTFGPPPNFFGLLLASR